MEPIDPQQPAAPMGWAPPAAPVAPPMQEVPMPSVVGRRVAAGFIDAVPLALVLVAVSSDRTTGDGTFRVEVRGLGLLVAVLAWAVYYGVTELLTGTSPGKRLLGLTVLDREGRSPKAGTVAVRTLLRCIDVLPAFYLVGFVAMMTNKDRRRLGDMAASTTVVSLQSAEELADREGRDRPHTRGPLALLIGAFVLVLGVVGAVAKVNEVPAADRLGSFEVERDMEPMVADVMAAIERGDPSEINALFHEGMATEDQIAGLLEQIDGAVGPFTGDYSVVDHSRETQDVPQLGGATELMNVFLDAEFERGTAQVAVTFGVVDDELVLLGWHVNG
ncbi:MAG: hypothetical protein RL238_2879 [Actinomycetota bacterium]